MWSTSLRRLSFLFMQRKKLKVVWFFKLGKLRKWWLNKQNFCFYALVRNSGERWGKVGKRWGKTQVKFIYLLLWFFLTLLYPCSILPNRVSSRNLLRGLVIAMMWYRSHQFDCLWLQQPPVRTCCFYFGSKRCQEEMGVLAQASPGTLQGMRSPAGMKAGGWLQGWPGQGGGCVRCCQVRHMAGSSAAWPLSVAFCCLCLEGFCCISVWCVCVVLSSCFNKDYWGPSLGVGKVESCQKLQSCFPPQRSTQLYFPPLFCLCTGRNTPTRPDISLSLSLFFPPQNPDLFCIT